MKHELLLPVGNKEMALAAIHNGADAIFMGVPGFNARGRSHDFELSELKEIIDLCHLYGVKVNLAFNIVIFENELEKATDVLEKIIPLKPDAFIVQDLGLARLIRKLAPHQVIHASTQMTITNHEAIALLEDLNIKRFVLGRENSIDEIKTIAEHTKKELEVFVHGALCVSYSGQCFTSESIGGRSANRGQCAQSCRFSYDLIVDGEKKDLVDRNFVVSPQDLCGIAEIPKLMELGVASFKIEGRLKTPDYVASAASSYRSVIDKSLQNRKVSTDEIHRSKKLMGTAYSRGFFPGWLHGVNHQQLVEGSFSAHRGFLIGKLSSISAGSIIIDLDEDLRSLELENGDGLLWSYFSQRSGGQKQEAGSFIFEIQPISNKKIQVFVDHDLKLYSEMIGAKVYLNHDKSAKKDLLRSWTDKEQFKRIPVEISADLIMNQPMKVSMSDGQNQVIAYSASPLSPARTAGLKDSFLQEELTALSATVFEAEKCIINRANSDDQYFISHKEIKEIRRSLCEQLKAIRVSTTVDRFSAQLTPRQEVESWVQEQAVALPRSSQLSQPNFNLLLREKAQVEDLVAAISRQELSVEDFESVTLDFEFGRDFLPSVELLKSKGIKVGIATTRVLKPQEYNNLKAIEKMAPDFILVRNLGALRYYTEVSPFNKELRGDFSLNVTNHLTADYLLKKGLSRLCISYDLNHQQVTDLLKTSDASRMEVTAHQYMPSFHMEHCVFAAFLSKGSSWRDCGKPCEKHRVELKDQFGNSHFIKPDQECRNTMFNARAQSAAHYLPQWFELGLGNLRYEALFERGDELIETIKTYRDFISGKMSEEQLGPALGPATAYGLSGGSLSRENEYISRKKF